MVHTVLLVEVVVSYRAVEHAFAIHGNVEATLHSLDGHHSQTHRNKIKQGCGEKDNGVVEGQRDREAQRHKEAGKNKVSDRKDRTGKLSFHLICVDTTAFFGCQL